MLVRSLLCLLLFNLLLPASAHSKGELLWEFKTGGEIWSPLSLRDEIAYFGSDDGTFYALDTRRHQAAWRYQTGARVRSAAAFAKDLVLFASDDGFLYALDRTSGKRVWKFDLGDAKIVRSLPSNLEASEYDYLKSSPVVAGETVYIGSADKHLYAIDVDSGKLKWKFATGDKIRATPLVMEQQVCVGSWDHFFYCVDRLSGTELWRYDSKKAIQASAAFADGKIIFGGRNPKLFALDAASGKERWATRYKDGSWVESSAIVNQDILYVGSSDSFKLSAFSVATGEELWNFNTGGWTWMSPLLDDGVIYIGSIGARASYQADTLLRSGFYAVDATSGKLLWQYQPTKLSGDYYTGGVFARPALTSKAILVADLDGSVKALAR
ncbi:MAG: PQQ-binding-like beta-propeller repeat protein [Pseudomonadota bacterium]